MLIIRLQRTGKKNAADFRIVLAEKKSSASKKFTEVLGTYNPRTKAFNIKNQDRLKYWIGQRVEISATVHNLLVSKNLLDAKKVQAFKVPKKPVVPEVKKPAEAVAPTVETPAEVAEATAEIESKVEVVPIEIPTVEESKPIPKPEIPGQPAA
jgi:small subunit ribosomal protein S16